MKLYKLGACICIYLALVQSANAQTPSLQTPPVQMQSTQTAVQTQPTKKSGPSQAPAEKYDTKLPIEISSDTLEVLQHENKAIFKGNVIAVQGLIRLKSDVMIVHYKPKSQQQAAASTAGQSVTATPSAPSQQSAASQPPESPKLAGVAANTPPAAVTTSSDQGSMGAITLIEVEGNVFVATPEESAKGDKGHYQVAEKMLYLTGNNVILTREKNILRGTELQYNLETGYSILTNKGVKVDNTNGGRVRGVFVPDQNPDKNKPDKGKPDKGKGNPLTNAATPASASPVTSPAIPATPLTITPSTQSH